MRILPRLHVSRKIDFILHAEDELVSTDELQEKLQTDFEDYIQSTDIAAMQSTSFSSTDHSYG